MSWCINITSNKPFRSRCATNKPTNYAERYFATINPTFGKASADCQNFASQCVWAGLGGESKGSIKVPPVVYDSVYGSSNQRLWQHNNYSQTAPYGYGWNWDHVDGFAWLIDSAVSANGVGPYGWVNFGTLAYAEPGDVIIWDTGGAPALGNLDHAMVVTKVSGTSGSRTINNIYICAHNDPTDFASEPLVDYAYSGMTGQYFANCRIFGGYYNVAQ